MGLAAETINSFRGHLGTTTTIFPLSARLAHAHVGRRAVVIGAGISGLAAASTLADFFEEVTVVERDSLPRAPADRPGTRNRSTFMRCSPAASKRTRDVASQFRAGPDGGRRRSAGRQRRFPNRRPDSTHSPLEHLVDVAAAIECVVRQQVEKRTNVRLRDRCRALELVLSADCASVAGVRR
jgi:2-polyprenyl-6-methoxyphenol hydroxylase-like FAD-dependent oxidoreductase